MYLPSVDVKQMLVSNSPLMSALLLGPLIVCLLLVSCGMISTETSSGVWPVTSYENLMTFPGYCSSSKQKGLAEIPK